MRSSTSPNPLEMSSAEKLNEFGLHVTNLQQKIDLIAAKSSASSASSPATEAIVKTPPPIEETGDVEKDFETVFEFNENAGKSCVEETQLVSLSCTSPPPPLPSSAPPLPREDAPPVPPPVLISKAVPVESLTKQSLKPWQKQNEYRPMSMVLKEKPSAAVVDPLTNIQFNFKPIEGVTSSEDLRTEKAAKLVSPLPKYTSQSADNLMDFTAGEEDNKPLLQQMIHGSLDNLFMRRHEDDLVMPDIDGIHGIKTSSQAKYKKFRHAIRPSVSHEELIRVTRKLEGEAEYEEMIFEEPKPTRDNINIDELVTLRVPQSKQEKEEELYENLEQIREEVSQLKLEAAQIDRRKSEVEELFLRPVVKKPQPLPRVNSQNELDRYSTTLSFVFDPKANEFVLESESQPEPRVKLLPNVDIIERNSALLQQRSSSTSNMVPIVVTSPRRSGPGFVKSMDSLDVLDPKETIDKSINEKGNFFNFRFFKKEKKAPPVPAKPQRQSVFYGEVNAEQKFEAKLVLIDDKDDGEDDGHEGSSASGITGTVNRSMSTFGHQSSRVEGQKEGLSNNTEGLCKLVKRTN